MRASNEVRICGHLGGNVEFKNGTSGVEVASMTVAENISRLDEATKEFKQVHTNWIPVSAFGSLAKRAAKSLKKGDRVMVLGSIKTRSYEKDGKTTGAFEIIADSIEKAELLARVSQEEAEVSDKFGSQPLVQ